MEQQTKVDIKPKITRASFRLSALENLKEATEDTRKSSEKLKRLFERNTYQKKTQLTVLKRYKRRLDAIEREEEARRKRSSRKKLKLPELKKFAGSFFAPGASNDPMKALATLSLFKTATNISEGKWFDAFLSGLTTAGLVAGPALLGLGLNSMFGDKGVKPRGRRGPKVSGDTGGFKFRTPFKRGAKVTGDTGGLNLRNPFRRKPKITGDVGRFSKIGKAFGRFGKSAIPIAGAALGAADAAIRANEGDVTGASIAGASASLDAISAGLTATGIGVLPAAALSAVSFGLDLVNLVRDLSGASEAESKRNKKTKRDKTPKETNTQQRLKEETQKQKDLARQKPTETGTLTFASTLNGYEKVITKFEKFVKDFKGFGKPETLEETRRNAENVERLVGNQESIEEPGYEFTQFTAQYLTGDPNSPAYDYSHGTSSNYHDHIAFHDREMAIRAYQYLESKGLDVTEFQGFDPVGGHSRGSYHYRGLAFDVPGYQWGASGPIDDRHFNGSRLVRKYLNEFFEMERTGNPNLKPKNKQLKPTPKPTPTPDKKTSPTPTPTPTPNPDARPKKERASINGFVYEMKNGKYYENGNEIQKQLYDAVKKNHRSKFKVISTKIGDDKSGVVIAFNPQTVAPMQPQQDVAQGSSTIILNSNKSKIEEVFTYNQFLNA
jgi:hypothetical protein